MDLKVCGKLLTLHRRGNGVDVEALRDRFPLQQIAEEAPRWDLTGTEGCGGGIKFSWMPLLVWGYVGIYRRKEYIGGGPRGPRGRGARPGGRALHPRGPLVAPLTDFFRLYISIYPKNFGEQYRSGVPPPQASVATKNESGPCSGTLPEGGSLTGGHLHHPGALHDKEGVVHPRG